MGATGIFIDGVSRLPGSRQNHFVDIEEWRRLRFTGSCEKLQTNWRGSILLQAKSGQRASSFLARHGKLVVDLGELRYFCVDLLHTSRQEGDTHVPIEQKFFCGTFR